MTKTLYEGMFLLDPNLAQKDWPGLEKHILDLLNRHGAETLYTEKWPERRLAYDVKGCKKGTYYLTYFNAPRDAIVELRRDIQLSERILRVLFVQEEGLAEEMEGRKSHEIEIPPADLSFARDRGFDSGGRSRRDGRPDTRRQATSAGKSDAGAGGKKEEGDAGEGAGKKEAIDATTGDEETKTKSAAEKTAEAKADSSDEKS